MKAPRTGRPGVVSTTSATSARRAAAASRSDRRRPISSNCVQPKRNPDPRAAASRSDRRRPISSNCVQSRRNRDRRSTGDPPGTAASRHRPTTNLQTTTKTNCLQSPNRSNHGLQAVSNATEYDDQNQQQIGL